MTACRHSRFTCGWGPGKTTWQTSSSETFNFLDSSETFHFLCSSEIFNFPDSSYHLISYLIPSHISANHIVMNSVVYILSMSLISVFVCLTMWHSVDLSSHLISSHLSSSITTYTRISTHSVNGTSTMTTNSNYNNHRHCYRCCRYSRWKTTALLNAGTAVCRSCLRIGDLNGLRAGSETRTVVAVVASSCRLTTSICSRVNS